MDELVTTTQVAERLGIARQYLGTILSRHPELRPARRLVPGGNYLWTREEIEKVIQLKANPGKGGRPRKQSEKVVQE